MVRPALYARGQGSYFSDHLLLTFVLIFQTSSHSVVTQRSGTMPWSPFIESTAAKLSQEGEFPSDQYLLSQVQMQHMLERVDSLVRRGFVENQATLVDVDAMVRSLQNEAKEYRALFPAIPRLDGRIAPVLWLFLTIFSLKIPNSNI